MRNILLINNQPLLDAFINQLLLVNKDEFICLDTEFTRVKSLFPQLNLIQICFNDRVFLIDAMADLDFNKFYSVLLSRDNIFLLFSAQEDLEIISFEAKKYNADNILPKNCIDIQLLFAFLNISYSSSLQNAIRDYLDITLLKDQTLSDWASRPLNDEQINYAADDVLYLKSLYLTIKGRYESNDVRFKWFSQEMASFLNFCTREVIADDCYLNINGAGHLNIKELNVLKYICSKRYKTAVDKNEALNRIITTKALCNTCIPQPQQ